MEALGLAPRLVPGRRDNLKITHPEDLPWPAVSWPPRHRMSVQSAMRSAADTMMRIGHGFDVHRFGEGDHLKIGGVAIPHTHGFVAHSDGDVLLHAVCDALLGACALGDIGHHFPDGDPAWLAPTAAGCCAMWWR